VLCPGKHRRTPLLPPLALEVVREFWNCLGRPQELSQAEKGESIPGRKREWHIQKLGDMN
jgi:hypothetical protein